MKYKPLVSHLFLIQLFLFQSVEGLKRSRFGGELALTKGILWDLSRSWSYAIDGKMVKLNEE